MKVKCNIHEPSLNGKTWLCIELPIVPYKAVWDLQHKFVTARKDGSTDKDIVLFLEHPPVFTIGRRGGLDNLTVSEAFLEKTGISVIHVERGGDITYHGPGQLVVYPIVDLANAGLKVLDYVTALEEVMIRTAADWGIEAGPNPMNRGVWVANKKLGSIGITIRRGISFHGIALNVNVSLEPFSWINPCGLKGIGMTSMAHELSYQVPMHQVCEAVKHHMAVIFGVKLEMTNLPELNGLWKGPV